MPVHNCLLFTGLPPCAQIEQLKKELSIRDLISTSGGGSSGAGVESIWLTDLTKMQRQRTNREVMRFVQAKDRQTDADQLESFDALSSLSQFRFFGSVLRDVIWTACDGSGDKVTSILEQMLSSNSQKPSAQKKAR